MQCVARLRAWAELPRRFAPSIARCVIQLIPDKRRPFLDQSPVQGGCGSRKVVYMSISAIDGSLGASSVAATHSLPSTPRQSSVPPPAGFGAAAPQISGPGQFSSKLQQLSETNPTQFKQVTQQISDQLRQQAQQSTGRAAQFENALADRYASAAQSGDLSALQPRAGSGASGAGHAHHHHGQGSGGGGAGGPLAAIFSNALDEINQALGATPGATGTGASSPLAT